MNYNVLPMELQKKGHSFSTLHDPSYKTYLVAPCWKIDKEYTQELLKNNIPSVPAFFMILSFLIFCK